MAIHHPVHMIYDQVSCQFCTEPLIAKIQYAYHQIAAMKIMSSHSERFKFKIQNWLTRVDSTPSTFCSILLVKIIQWHFQCCQNHIMRNFQRYFAFLKLNTQNLTQYAQNDKTDRNFSRMNVNTPLQRFKKIIITTLNIIEFDLFSVVIIHYKTLQLCMFSTFLKL